ncbi:MAG: endonuclease [Gaiellales bacterium]|nr:endonuclease [Gaiellales bacterium]MDX6545647.1 endonuclease [Gaiellales bacterium]MDX6550138.1 endonuclease [Gaiellales bacterium]
MNARAERAQLLLDRLAQEHPDAHIALDYGTPLELLVATILSAQCTDARVNQVTPELFALCRTAADYVALSQERLEQLIRPTGFFRNKARAIRAACASILDDFGGEVPETLDELVRLHGVGRKTAAVVSSNAFGRRDGIAVDTHVGRVSRRLALTRHGDPVKVERALMRLYPRERWLEVSDVLIFHGRRVCEARRPRCGECAVAEMCPSARV